VVEAIRIASSLEEALRDCVYSVALTARERTAKRTVLRPSEAAAELAARAAEGPVAMVAGREDKGLTNEELDLCHALVTIPVAPEYRSLNLAQALAIMAYESWVARGGGSIPLKRPRRTADPVTGDQLERLFADWRQALWSIDFFKTRMPEHVMRSLREMVYRADLDGREATLLRAMALEVVRFLEREGISTLDREVPGNPEER
jgi:TrmH family RNA methyltransferase